MNHLSSADITRLASETSSDCGTVRRWMRGAPLRSTSRQRLERAALRLGIPIPTQATAEAAPPSPSTAVDKAG